METVLETQGGVRILRLSGRLDLVAAPGFESTLLGLIRGGATKIVLECSGLSYVSSSGLGAFVAGGKALGGDGQIVFAGMSRQLLSLFEMTGFRNLFSVCADVGEALEHLAEA